MGLGVIYILHFDDAYHKAKHYVGFCEEHNLDKRIQTHFDGNGSPLVHAAISSGIEVTVARTFPGGTRDQERWIKNQKGTPHFCPKCKKKPRNLPGPRGGGVPPTSGIQR